MNDNNDTAPTDEVTSDDADRRPRPLERPCRARSSQRKRPCRRPAIKGGTVCLTHGGSAPQVRRRANERLLEMVEPALVRLRQLAVDRHRSVPAAVALGACRDILDRAGVGRASDTGVPIGHTTIVILPPAGLLPSAQGDGDPSGLSDVEVPTLPPADDAGEGQA